MNFKFKFLFVVSVFAVSLCAKRKKEKCMKNKQKLWLLFAVIGIAAIACNDSIPDPVIPQITAHPQEAVYIKGSTAAALVVTATVTDGGELSYKWYSNQADNKETGTVITNATGASYMPPTGIVGIMYYYTEVSNTLNGKSVRTTSNTAKIEVRDEINAAVPQITVNLSNAVYTIGTAPTALTVTAARSDNGTLSYQWYRNTTNSTTGGTIITGATTASYTPPVDAPGTVYYFVIVTNTIIDNGDGGKKTASVISNIAEIKVDNPSEDNPGENECSQCGKDPCDCPTGGNECTQCGEYPCVCPSLNYLSVNINRSGSTSSEFKYSVNSVPGATGYETRQIGGDVVGSWIGNSATVEGLDHEAFSYLTARALKSGSDASLPTPLPGLVKYPDATKTMDGYNEWFCFLNYGLALLQEVAPGAYTSTLSTFHANINAIHNITSEEEGQEVKDLYASTANLAMMAVMDNWTDILEEMKKYPNVLKDVETVMPRIWFNANEIGITGPGRTSLDAVMLQEIQKNYPGVKTVF